MSAPENTRLAKGRNSDKNQNSANPRERTQVENLKRIIRDMGLKVTEQRLAILEALARSRVHVTVQEIYENISLRHPELGFATVYRFLRNLTAQGFVTEVRTRGLPARYELTPRSHHDHLVCTGCGRIVEFANPDIEELQSLVAYNHGFALTGHVLELYGLCPQCQQNSLLKESVHQNGKI